MDKLDYQEITDLALSTGATVTLTGLQIAIITSVINSYTQRHLWRVDGVRPDNDQWDNIRADLSAIEDVLLS